MKPELRIPTFEIDFDGKTYIGEPATVGSFHIGVEDHGIWTALVGFEGPAWGQGLPAIGLDEYDQETKKRRVADGSADYLYRLIQVLGSPEQAKGRRVIVFREKAYGDIKGVSALNDDGTFSEPFWNVFREDEARARALAERLATRGTER